MAKTTADVTVHIADLPAVMALVDHLTAQRDALQALVDDLAAAWTAEDEPTVEGVDALLDRVMAAATARNITKENQ